MRELDPALDPESAFAALRRPGRPALLFDGRGGHDGAWPCRLALDPCVSEAFMKLYVAYKAETNFVDVVPQAQRLRLSINLTFAEINDPKGLCKDVTNLGRWGNGDVEVSLKSLDELPYVMGLVRQSYERQMGDGGQA